MDTRYHSPLLTKDTFEAFYTIRNRASVTTFLEKHDALPPLLVDVARRLQQHFGNAPLSLDVHIDPEDSTAELVVSVGHNDLSYHDMRTRMRQFDDDWWRDASQSVLGIFTVLPELE